MQGKVIRFPRPGKDRVVKSLKLLLANAHQVEAFAYVAITETGPIAGVVNTSEGLDTLEVAELLIDALKGDPEFVVPAPDC